jgi:LysM repeat protein
MTCFGRARRCAIGVALCLSLAGCLPPADSPLDEKKDPSFITGKNLVSQMDWPGAIEAFEKALDSNPRSASAHFELGWLYEEKADPQDPAAAIYHYERYLKLSPNPDKADLVRQQINSCKLILVKNMAVVGPSGAQREMDRLSAENRELQAQVAQLQSQAAQLQSQLAQARAAAADVRPQPLPRPPVQSPTPLTTVPTGPAGDSPRTETQHVSSGHVATPVSNHISSTGVARLHSVKPHETMAGIAREYGISLAALESANPQVRPTHLLVGQALKIPAP